MYMSESVGPNSRGRPPGRWRNRVKEYMSTCVGEVLWGKGGLVQAKREYLDKERWRLFCLGHPLERGVRAMIAR